MKRDICFYVAVNGDDKNPGTKEKPFATLARARDAVRELKNRVKGPITALVRGGTYYLSEPLVFGLGLWNARTDYYLRCLPRRGAGHKWRAKNHC